VDFVSIPVIVGYVIITGMTIGGILAFPTARRLGRYLEVLIEEKRGKGVGMGEHVERLERELRDTQAELARTTERQAFLESLLEERAEPPLLPRA
jgi:hypothetical protein